MAEGERWHLSEEAIYDFVDRALGPAAMIEAERHLRSCSECARLLRRAEHLFARLEAAEPPRLERDLAPDVVANLQLAGASRRHWGWILAAESVGAAIAIAGLSFRLDPWMGALLTSPAYVTVREHGLRLAAEAAAWLAPFFDLIPSYPSRLTPIRVAIPHLDGPVLGWVGLAMAALALGLVGNAVLLRSANGLAEKTGAGVGARVARPGRIGRGSHGGRK